MANFVYEATPALGGSVPSPAYTGTFIPEIWSGKIIEKFYDATVLAAIANTDYEGEIKNYGETVKIRQKPDVAITAYTPEVTLSVTRPSVAAVDLEINKGFYWNVALEDVMEVQSDINMLSMWADDASEQLKISVDTEVLDNINADIAAANKGATAGAISGNIDLGATAAAETVNKTNVLDYIIKMGQVLDEQNIPETGRWIVIPAWFASLIKQSDLKDASLAGDNTSIMRNGRLGMIDRFTLYLSNHVKTVSDTGTKYHVYAGHSHGLTFASQLTKVETLRAETTFATLMRGLQIFGYKVTDGTAVCELYCNP